MPSSVTTLIGEQSQYITNHSAEFSQAITQCLGAVSTNDSWDVNRHRQ